MSNLNFVQTGPELNQPANPYDYLKGIAHREVEPYEQTASLRRLQKSSANDPDWPGRELHTAWITQRNGKVVTEILVQELVDCRRGYSSIEYGVTVYDDLSKPERQALVRSDVATILPDGRIETVRSKDPQQLRGRPLLDFRDEDQPVDMGSPDYQAAKAFADNITATIQGVLATWQPESDSPHYPAEERSETLIA